MKFATWNINGIRSAETELLQFLDKYSPDILGLQEVKAHPDQLGFTLHCHPDYEAYWHWCEEKSGYSGTAVLVRRDIELSQSDIGIGESKFDSEGRVISVYWNNYVFINTYFPFGGREGRLKYKMDFCDSIYKITEDHLREGRKVILVGDINISHMPIDIFNPEAMGTTSVFLPEEREWFSKYLKLGMIDSYRLSNQQTQEFTWWPYTNKARTLSNGMRIDYILLPESITSIKQSCILKNQYGSDHCPVLTDCIL
jgi:exodeoxyribonuclease-3